ncbi:hypothetical protein T02_13183 [Trichinella nativa]|uniref:Uncharacterized protein n=3 Tax=Trichinella TaxID=6333 RepID=A0A0V1LAW3_9BILA|nr:hypothetical protein T05_9785 [Trichinella murrelli]KRX66996.1 hypothetical protein T09_8182 [Trichinella sp. T9]KRX73320.1 hypothetical protein T06_16659 [Trichinella sp. T6]KRY53075.1 hypothetical protein T03_817 [Trichinella britovi]KRZ56370.1 hypothetical protein T02_13183 [Trichinella nativa]KRZ91424.1 hypothetical protein T08_6437 [Trichinella sp. T8]
MKCIQRSTIPSWTTNNCCNDRTLSANLDRFGTEKGQTNIVSSIACSSICQAARVGLIGRALALISPTRPAIEFKPFLQKPDDPSWSRFWACAFKINHQVKPSKTVCRD